MHKETYTYREERTDFIVGMITIAIVLGLFVWLLVSVTNSSNKAMGKIVCPSEVRRGVQHTYTYVVNNVKLRDGDKIVWTVDGKTVHQDVYSAGKEASLDYTPSAVGKQTLTAAIGKYSKTVTLDVLPPQLTVTAPNIAIVYGEQLPQLNCELCGALPGDDVQPISCAGLPECERLAAGVYTLCPERGNETDYDVEYICGTLTVLPRQLTAADEIVKQYDGTNIADPAALRLDGVLDGDDVAASCDKLYFDNKNVGDGKSVPLANVQLVGKDAHNYTLPDCACGRIAPRHVQVVGLTVKDKLYDGTTKATIDKMGALAGVLSGDSVAIGNIRVTFDAADAGKRSYTVADVTLVGADKSNYVVDDVQGGSANITAAKRAAKPFSKKTNGKSLQLALNAAAN